MGAGEFVEDICMIQTLKNQLIQQIGVCVCVYGKGGETAFIYD